MYIVVDPNVVISSAMNMGNSLNIFIKNFEKERFEFITPNFFVIELGKYTEKIAKKTRFSFQEVVEVVEFVINQITYISDEEWIEKIKVAAEVLKEHQKDVPYLALALKYNCNILSGDRVFKQLCPTIVKNPRDLLEEFGKEEIF